MALPGFIRDNLTLPAVCAPMFLCTGVELATETCKAGLIGTLTRNHCRNTEEFEAQLKAVSEALARFRDEHPGARIGPLAANISPLRMEGEEVRLHMNLCKRYGVRIIITAVGDPTPTVPYVHEAEMIQLHDVTSVRFAEKAMRAGVDGLIAIGAGGGGHSGTISHLALIPQLRAIYDGIIVLAGAVSTGAVIRAAEVLGADLAYLGTRFIATRESLAPDDYKAMIVAGGPADVIYTNRVNGMAANWLKESLRSLGLDPDNLPEATGHNTDHLPPGIFPWKNVFSAGQGIALIDDVPSVAELVGRLQAEYLAACAVPDFAGAAREALEGVRA